MNLILIMNFVGSTEKYQNGDFNETILSIFENIFKNIRYYFTYLKSREKRNLQLY